MVIYADVLVILNLYINYFLVRAAAILLRRGISAKRCLLAGAVGALAALAALLPEMPFWAVALIKVAVTAAMTLCAFGFHCRTDFLVAALCLLTISFVFAGLMMALWLFFAPFDMVYSNGVAYFNIPIAAIAGFTAVSYGLVKTVRFFADKRLRCSKICAVTVTANGCTKTIKGLSDTGNGLRDIFSGKPAVVCSRNSIEPLIPQNVLSFLDSGTAAEGIRLIPCRTVTDETLIPIFTPDKIEVSGKPASAVVGISRAPLGDDVDCVFNPEIISL